jgi:hypothetical protein
MPQVAEESDSGSEVNPIDGADFSEPEEEPAPSGKRCAPPSCGTAPKKQKKSAEFVPAGGSTSWIDASERDKRATRPADTLLAKIFRLSQDLQHPDGKPFFRCLGYSNGCRQRLASPLQRKRALKHAAKCAHLRQDLRASANSKLSSSSTSAQLDLFIASSQASLAHASTTDGSSNAPAPGPTVHSMAKASGAKKTQLTVTKELVLWMCTTAQAAKCLDNAHFRNMVAALNSKYHSPSSSTYEDTLLPQECAYVEEQALKYLRTLTHLSLSFDAGTVKNGKSNIHCTVSTEDGRQFLFEGKDGSGFSHTGKYYADFLQDVSPVQHLCCSLYLTIHIGHCSHWPRTIQRHLFRQHWQHHRCANSHFGGIPLDCHHP